MTALRAIETTRAISTTRVGRADGSKRDLRARAVRRGQDGITKLDDCERASEESSSSVTLTPTRGISRRAAVLTAMGVVAATGGVERAVAGNVPAADVAATGELGALER